MYNVNPMTDEIRTLLNTHSERFIDDLVTNANHKIYIPELTFDVDECSLVLTSKNNTNWNNNSYWCVVIPLTTFNLVFGGLCAKLPEELFEL